MSISDRHGNVSIIPVIVFVFAIPPTMVVPPLLLPPALFSPFPLAPGPHSPVFVIPWVYKDGLGFDNDGWRYVDRSRR